MISEEDIKRVVEKSKLELEAGWVMIKHQGDYSTIQDRKGKTYVYDSKINQLYEMSDYGKTDA